MAAQDIHMPEVRVDGGRSYEVDGARFILGDGADGSGAPSGDPPKPERPGADRLVIAPDTIRSAEDILIMGSREAAATYEALRQKVLELTPWVYRVGDPKELEVDPTQQNQNKGKWASETGQGTMPGDPYDAEAQTQQDRSLLKGVGDFLGTVGTYVAMLNDAAQSYAKCDIKSYPPTSA
ncbi:hypothetical protein ABT369_25750 [Dactylosporangium sp. NPDC000244]|uniref:hypothetical protein n=1 Tax=Dactylosporangium sp. NPDC000244 TaxID=3154365 RepID=UPI003316BBA5